MTYDKDKLRAHQLECVALLAKAHRFFEAEDIAYVIEAGTLLGAVRHGGFIPWDDDIDMLVLEEDFHKLVTLSRDPERTMERYGVRVGLSATDPYYVYVSESTSDTHTPIVFIDIFLLKRYRSYRSVRFLKKIHRILFDIAHYSLGFSGVFPDMKTYPKSWLPILQKGTITVQMKGSGFGKKFFRKLLMFRIFWRAFVPPLAWLFRRCQRCFLDPKGVWFLLHSKSRFPAYYMHRSDMFPRSSVTFEGLTVYAPRDIRVSLDHYFGKDYMTLPPESSRNPKHFYDRFK